MRIGRNFKLYIGSVTLASAGSNTWTELKLTGNADHTVTAQTANTSVRTVFDELTTVTGISREITFELMDHAGATYVATLETAFNAGSIFSFAIMNGPMATAGSKGVRMDAVCTSFSRTLGLDGAVVINVTIRPALSVESDGDAFAPEAYTVPA